MSRPNILFFLIDDLGCRDLGCYGSSFYETPHLDRLAERGMLFTRAYASCPVCSPTRASILTGKYPARVGITQYIGGQSEGKLKDVPYLHYLPLEEKSLAAALKDNGYQTWHVGKWHLGDGDFLPQHHGFDVNIGGCHWGMPYQGYFSPWQIPGLPDVEEKGVYLTDYLTAEATRIIRERDRERPFFLNFSHYSVHTPIQAPQPLVDKYREKAKRLRLDQIDPYLEGEPFPCLHRADQRVKRRMLQSDPVYAAMVENLDTNIGLVLKTLEDEGLADDTIIVFTSDNGGLATSEGSPTCNHPYAEGKGWNYEGGARVCQLVKWNNNIRPGSRCHVPVTSTDFYPTLLEAAGLPLMPEQHCDGISLMPALKEAGPLDREALYWHYPHYSNQGGTPAASMIMGDWKLIENFEDGRLELYDLSGDVSERTNLAGVDPERAKRMHAKLRAWQQEIEALIPEPNPEYEQALEKKLRRPEIPNNAHI